MCFFNSKATGERWLWGGILALVLGGFLAGCAVKPQPLTLEDRNQQIVLDLADLFATQPPLKGPITIHQAMARALHYNLAHRLKVMEEVLAKGLNRVTSQKLLPRVVAEAGYTSQDRLSTLPGQLSTTTGSLGITWNVLDFGVSYLNAHQQADRTLIAEQIRRKAAHVLIREVRTTFWQAIAAQRFKKMAIPLMKKLKGALESAYELEKERIDPPMQALDFQVTLLETLQKLQQLEQDIADARIKLAGLMGFDPNHSFELLEPEETNLIENVTIPSIEVLEQYALRHRPELWERDYRRRIKSYETKKALLRLLPGLEFSQSRKYDTTETNANSVWAAFGIKLTWNLLNLIHAPDTIALAKDEERMEDFRRLALNMSVLAQVHIARRRLAQSHESFFTVSRLSQVKERLYQHSKAEQQAETLNELQLISREGDRVLFMARRDLAYAQWQNALGIFFSSLGVDMLPKDSDSQDLDTLENHIKLRSELFHRGHFLGVELSLVNNTTPKWVMGKKVPNAVSTQWLIKQDNTHSTQSLPTTPKRVMGTILPGAVSTEWLIKQDTIHPIKPLDKPVSPNSKKPDSSDQGSLDQIIQRMVVMASSLQSSSPE